MSVAIDSEGRAVSAGDRVQDIRDNGDVYEVKRARGSVVIVTLRSGRQAPLYAGEWTALDK